MPQWVYRQLHSSDSKRSNIARKKKAINKSHWLINVSRAHFIGRERFPKHHLIVFLEFLTHLQFFYFKIILTDFQTFRT